MQTKSNWFDRHFGIEIEMVLPQQTLIQNHNDLHFYLHDIQDSNGENMLFNEWQIKKDITIHIDQDNNDLLGFEIISPKLLYCSESKRKIHEICNILSASPLNAYLNVSCGFHVHCDANNINLQQTHQIAMNYNFYECIIDEYMSTSRRGNNNPHCKSLDFLNNSPTVPTCIKTMDKYLNPKGKNYKLNFCVLKKYMKLNTIENRHHNGSCNGAEMLNWIKFNLLFVHQSLYCTQSPVDSTHTADVETRQQMLWRFINDDKLAKYFQNKTTNDDNWMLQKINDQPAIQKQKQTFFSPMLSWIGY